MCERTINSKNVFILTWFMNRYMNRDLVLDNYASVIKATRIAVFISLWVIHKMKWSIRKTYSFITVMSLSKHCTVWQLGCSLWMILTRAVCTAQERNQRWIMYLCMLLGSLSSVVLVQFNSFGRYLPFWEEKQSQLKLLLYLKCIILIFFPAIVQ